MADAKKTITMDDLLKEEKIQSLATGEVVEGTVLTVKKHEVLIDLGPLGVGIVPRREIGFNQKLTEGDPVTASVIEKEMDDGYSLLSLRKAAKDRGWDEVARIVESEEIIDVTAYDANRGGLLIELEGVRGFLPVSQLSAEHYPRVGSADKDEILQRLNALVGKSIKVRVLDADRKTNKLIFSEKEAIKDGLSERFEKMKVGDIVKGVITGVIDYGAFVNVEGIEGLIHISEISWERVNNPSDYVKVGQNVEAKVIAIDKERLSLSLKQLQEDPWLSEVEQFQKGAEVEGTVTRITPFGAFVQLSPAVEALVHVSELGDGEGADPEKVFTLNERKAFRVLEVDKDNRKISLSLKKK
ncbi:MAG TPA: S1 RNA-binding domain-containing protein [Candidatus Saccharibacteria bacterium]|nr:S1 RNA-binding domain-containing protein [Candidatus Saccharibacteria bacterium]